MVGTAPAVRENDVAYKQFHRDGESLNPVGRQNVDKATGEVVEYADIIRGYVAANGAVVEVNDAELDALAPQAGKHIEISKFVDLDDVRYDDLFFSKNEYAWPKKGAEKAYALMVEALAKMDKAGLGTTVRRGKAQPVLIRSVRGVLVLTFLHWDDEVRSAESVGVNDEISISDAEIGMAEALIGAMAGDWKPAELVDEFRENAVAMLEAKSQGVQTAPAAKVETVAQTDLMAVLAASVEASKKAKVAK
jgi:DNA end-binding protein Ku